MNDLLVACYAIGWAITQEELTAYPHLRFAEGGQDTGVIIAFNSEAEDVNDSLLVLRGRKACASIPSTGAPMVPRQIKRKIWEHALRITAEQLLRKFHN